MSRDLKTISQFATETTFSEPQCRWWIFNAANNGLDTHRAIVRIGRRVYIDPAAFDRWIDAQQPQQASA